MTRVDIVVGLQYGDEAKCKVAFCTLQKAKWSRNQYTHVAAASGGPNKGHSLYYHDYKYVLHQIPCGVMLGTISIIGSGCVVDVKKLFQEIKVLEASEIDVKKNLKVAYNAHIITEEMLKEDAGGGTIGSTSCGIMQAYRAKYGRTGKRAEDIKELKPFLVDTTKEFHRDEYTHILVEGAQGAMLCPDWSDNYPYVTSGIPTATYALHSLGVNASNLNKVIGCMKAYNTYSGNREDFERGSDEDKKIYQKIVDIGQEKGNTTGRVRKICWNDMKQLKKAILINGCDEIVVSKMDILKEIGVFKVFDIDGKLIQFQNEDEFKAYLTKFTKNLGSKVIFSYSPIDI